MLRRILSSGRPLCVLFGVLARAHLLTVLHLVRSVSLKNIPSSFLPWLCYVNDLSTYRVSPSKSLSLESSGAIFDVSIFG